MTDAQKTILDKTQLAHNVRKALVELTLAIEQAEGNGLQVKLLAINSVGVIQSEMAVSGTLHARITETTAY